VGPKEGGGDDQAAAGAHEGARDDGGVRVAGGGEGHDHRQGVPAAEAFVPDARWRH